MYTHLEVDKQWYDEGSCLARSGWGTGQYLPTLMGRVCRTTHRYNPLGNVREIYSNLLDAHVQCFLVREYSPPLVYLPPALPLPSLSPSHAASEEWPASGWAWARGNQQQLCSSSSMQGGCTAHRAAQRWPQRLAHLTH